MAILNRLPEQGTLGFFGGVFLGSCAATVVWFILGMALAASLWGGR